MKRAKSKEEVVPITLRLSRSQWEAINYLSIDRRTSVTELIRQAITEFLKKEGAR